MSAPTPDPSTQPQGEPDFFITAARGTERALIDEMVSRGLPREAMREQPGGVGLCGDLEAAYRVMLWSRVASRVLMPVTRFAAADPDALYQGIGDIDWSSHMTQSGTLAVSVAGRSASEQLSNTRFVAQRVKDAVVDQLRTLWGHRPAVDLQNPDLRINIHLRGLAVRVSLDLSGEALHRRGINRQGAAAPLKENLAAALLQSIGWPAMAADGAPLVDPLCGSGTFLLEGMWMALDVAPGLLRMGHGFERWPQHDADLWSRLCQEAQSVRDAAASREVRGFGFDQAREALEAAEENVARAGLSKHVRFERAVLDELRPPEGVGRDEPPRGLLVTNPPYGERLGHTDDLGPLYAGLGDILKRRFPGWRAGVLTGNKALAKQVGLKTDARATVYNGPIQCLWLSYTIHDAAVADDKGPRWRQPSNDAQMLVNRLRKNKRTIGKWARKQGVSCYRIYDADIPEYNVSIDLYGEAVHIQEYEPPRKVDGMAAERRRRDVQLVIPEVLGVAAEDVAFKMRRRRPGGQQYRRRDDQGGLREVQESGLRFLVNLTDYLDTGLFLDGRVQRALIKEHARGEDVLNLYAYTCTASVYAAAGGARSTTSVDLSSTYLDWGRRNMELNDFHGREHRFVRDDCFGWLAHQRRQYGLIFVAPPTFSISRRTAADFDVQRDHVRLLQLCVDRLAPGGRILFSNALQTFTMDHDALPDLLIEDISQKTVPRDFARRSKIHKAWWIQRRT